MSHEPSARRIWRSIETIHAVTYFAPGSTEAMTRLGLKGFWMCYFAARAAPLGAVGPSLVEATFYNFSPALVRRAIPDAWARATPEACLATRSRAAADALRSLVPGVDAEATGLIGLLEPAVRAASCIGRPLGAVNQQVELPDDPVERLWQLTTVLREHRGDGHVAALVSHDIDGIECHVLSVAAGVAPADRMLQVRGWTADEWDAASRRLEARGLVRMGDEPSVAALTDQGEALRAAIEAATDLAAAQPYRDGLTPAGVELLITLSRRVAAPIASSGLLPFPNPIGLPR